MMWVVACVINTVWLCLVKRAVTGDWTYDLCHFGPGRFQTVKYFIRNNKNSIWYLLYGFCYAFLLWWWFMLTFLLCILRLFMIWICKRGLIPWPLFKNIELYELLLCKILGDVYDGYYMGFSRYKHVIYGILI